MFQRLLLDGKLVSWTREAVTEDANFQRRTRYGYMALAILLLALGLVGHFLWHKL